MINWYCTISITVVPFVYNHYLNHYKILKKSRFLAAILDLKQFTDIIINFTVMEDDKCHKSALSCAKSKSGLKLHDFELTTTCDGPHDAIADRRSCSVRPSAILSASILTIGGYRRASERFEHVQKYLRHRGKL